MTRTNLEAEYDDDSKKKGDAGPKQAKNERAPHPQVNIDIGDVSGISGKVTVAGGDIITSATPQEIDREYELAEVAKLKQSLLKKRSSLVAMSSAQPDHKFDGTPLDIGEGQYLAGRTDFVGRFLQKLKHHQTVILSGASGIGKTSFLQAGLVPRLLEERYLPILVDVTNQSLSESIKLEMMSGVASTKYLWPLSLAKFLEDAAECLEPDEKLLLVLDGSEKLSEWSSAVVDAFLSQWDQTKENLRLKWLFSIDRGFSASIAFFPEGEEVELPPLDRIAATQAILSIEKQPGELGEQNLKEILDGLESYREQLDGARINPAELQIVLQVLTKGNADKPLAKRYEDSKGFSGIFETFLIDVVNRKFKPVPRLIVREILTIFEDRYQTDVPVDWLKSRIKTSGNEGESVPSLLARLKQYRILTVRDHAYELASIRMKRAVRSWLDQQSLLDQAEAESKMQLNRIRTSALRGLIGGAIGLVIFRWLVGTPVRDLAAVIFYSLLYGAMGGTVGLLLTFMIDVFIARHGVRRAWQRYLLSSAMGFMMFAVALAVFVYLGEDVEDNAVLQLFRAALTGGAWGAVTGVGIAWALGSAKIPLWSIPVTAMAGSVTLHLFNLLFRVLNNGTKLEVLVGGFLFSLIIVSVVLYRKYTEPA